MKSSQYAEFAVTGTTGLLQESTRPLINEEMISNAWTCYKQNGSAIASSLMTDYVQFIETDEGSLDLDREKVYSIQSPEVYNLRNLLDAISEAEINRMPLNHTCCAMLMYDLKRKLHYSNSIIAFDVFLTLSFRTFNASSNLRLACAKHWTIIAFSIFL